MADSDLSKWAGAGIALISAAGAYVGSAIEAGKTAGAMNAQVKYLSDRVDEHDRRDRQFESEVREKISDIDARVRVLESRR